MNSITIEKSKLLEVLKANREKHREIFLEAQGNYRKAVIAELDRMLAEAKSGQRVRRQVLLPEPIDQTREYDRAIRMLEMASDATIDINEQDFRCYVMDEWNWRTHALNINKTYSVSAANYADSLGLQDDN